MTHPGYLAARKAALPLAVFEADCIFRSWAVEALERAGLRYQIVYVSRSISGLLDAVRAGLAVAPIVRSNVPADLKIAGPEKGLPSLPVSNVILHMAKKPVAETIACFAEHLRSSFREKV